MLSPGTKARDFRRQNECRYRTRDINQKAPLPKDGGESQPAPPSCVASPALPRGEGKAAGSAGSAVSDFQGRLLEREARGSAAPPFPFTKHRLPGVQGVKGFVWLGSSSEPALSGAGAFLCLYPRAGGSRFIFTLEAFTAAQQAPAAFVLQRGSVLWACTPLMQ